MDPRSLEQAFARFRREHEILMAVGALPFGRLSYAATSPEGWSAKGSLDLAAGPELHLRVAIPLMRAR